MSAVPLLTLVVHDDDQGLPFAAVHVSENSEPLTASVVADRLAGADALPAASTAVTV